VRKVCTAAPDFRRIGHGNEVVFEGKRDHNESDDEKGAANNDTTRLGDLQFGLFAHVNAEQVGL